MAPRSPARWLAPLALAAAAIALLVVLTSSSSDQPAIDSAPPAPTTETTAPKRRAARSSTTTAPARTGPTSGAKTYTVQSGDILATVAAKTGVSVERLRELNPGLDANAMTVGQQIKLAP
jgi:LysM repeat protein